MCQYFQKHPVKHQQRVSFLPFTKLHSTFYFYSTYHLLRFNLSFYHQLIYRFCFLISPDNHTLYLVSIIIYSLHLSPQHLLDSQSPVNREYSHKGAQLGHHVTILRVDPTLLQIVPLGDIGAERHQLGVVRVVEHVTL